MTYIPSQALAGLRNYRYKGVDKYVYRTIPARLHRGCR
jgi:hypothetical protein